MLRLITDGACEGNPGPGGWAAILVHETEVEELGGFESQTTNNRMELRAAIEGLRRVSHSEAVQVITDSQYLLRGITEWLPAWKKRNWRTSNGNTVENRDLWEELDGLTGGNVSWEWVHGHAGHPENERVDQIAQAYSKRQRIPPTKLRIAEPSPVYEIDPPSFNRPPGDSYLSLVNGVLTRHSRWVDCEAHIHGISGAKIKKCHSLQEEINVVQGWALDVHALQKLASHKPQKPQDLPVNVSSSQSNRDMERIQRPHGTSYLSLVNGVLKRHATWEECKSRTNNVPGAKFKKCLSVEEEKETVKRWGLGLDDLKGLNQSPQHDLLQKDNEGKETPDSYKPPQIFLPITFLEEVKNKCLEAGFLLENNNDPNAALRMHYNNALAVVYKNGRVQFQGTWKQTEQLTWNKIIDFEPLWIDKILQQAHDLSSSSTQPSWDECHIQYLRALIFNNRLPGWDAELIGRYLSICRSNNNQTAAVLGETEWRTSPSPEISAELWISLQEARKKPDRWCAARIQQSNKSLSLVVLPLTVAVQQLAQQWDWEIDGISPQEGEQVLKTINPHMPQVYHGSWPYEKWKTKADKMGNQLDFIYDWLRERVLEGSSRLGVSSTWPIELFIKASGNEDWARRLLEQRSDDRISYRQAWMSEETGGLGLASFWVRHLCNNQEV
ncbi:MAG: ribonuclease HI [Clostridia bacterium]